MVAVKMPPLQWGFHFLLIKFHIPAVKDFSGEVIKHTIPVLHAPISQQGTLLRLLVQFFPFVFGNVDVCCAPKCMYSQMIHSGLRPYHAWWGVIPSMAEVVQVGG